MMRTSKKRKSSGNPSIGSVEKPGDVLRRMSSKIPTDIFLKLLETNLYPALDELSPDAHSHIIERLNLAQQDFKAAESLSRIQYDVHEKSLNAEVKVLLKDVKYNGDDGYEEQTDMMIKIAKEVVEWLPHLWRVGVENRLEIQLVRKCLTLCTTVIQKVEGCDSPVGLEDLDFDLMIIDITGNVVYEDNPHIMQSIAWVWTELLISVASTNGSTKAILADIDRLRFKDEVYGYLQWEDKKQRPDGHGYWQDHWTPEMRAVAIKLFDERHQARIQAFEDNLSFVLYRQICSKAPRLKARLLETTRGRIFDKKVNLNNGQYRAAAEIFESDSPKDLLRLYDALPAHAKTVKTKQIIVRGLAKSKSSELRQKALIWITQGLETAKRRVIQEVENTFEYYDDALTWLSNMIEDGKLSVRSPNSCSTDAALQKANLRRERMFDQFIEKADGKDREDDSSDSMVGYDSEESEESEESDYGVYENYVSDEEKTILSSQEDMLFWLEMLGDWKNKKEAEKVWEQVKESRRANSGGNHLFVVDGLAIHLANVCDRTNYRNGYRQGLSYGLRAMYKVFTCKSIAELDQKEYIPRTETSGHGVEAISIKFVPTFD